MSHLEEIRAKNDKASEVSHDTQYSDPRDAAEVYYRYNRIEIAQAQTEATAMVADELAGIRDLLASVTWDGAIHVAQYDR